jgi:4,5-DOPA dioxygenase extradiol
MTGRMPAAFIGHGSPMNALEDNRYTAAWQQLAATLPRPTAVLAISAHWYTRGTAVTAVQQPKTIHDFRGFPPELFAFQYRAPGDPALAQRAAAALAPIRVIDDRDWGLDHGSWSVLARMYPKADVPVVQLSIDGTREAAYHYELGRRLSSLRDEGVLILGSGNVVHNLRQVDFRPDAPAPDWASGFESAVREHVLSSEHQSLIDYERLNPGAAQSVPTPDHYLPLLYVLGTQADGDRATIPIDGIELGAASMLSVVISPSATH